MMDDKVRADAKATESASRFAHIFLLENACSGLARSVQYGKFKWAFTFCQVRAEPCVGKHMHSIQGGWCMALPTPDPHVVDFVRARDVELALSQCPWPRIQMLRVEVCDGVVTVSGYVRSYHEKQIAQREVMRIAGVCQLDDCLEVISH